MTENGKKIDYEKAFNALAEAVLRLKGKKGPEFMDEFGLFLKGGMAPMTLAEVVKKKRKKKAKTFFAPFASDKLAVQYLMLHYGYSEDEASILCAKWRKLASDLGYTGPILWIVKAGYTLKSHAPLAGPCYEKFGYLQDWKFNNDKPTAVCTVFFIPRIVAPKKNADEQLQILAELRAKYDLPAGHLNSFGSAGLILAHFKRTGERAPLNTDWVRTDTLNSDGNRLDLGGFGEHGLYCDDYYWDFIRNGDLGVFPLGVVMGH